MLVPASYDLKLDRAEKHLIELEDAIHRYVSRHAYEVSVGIEGKETPVHRFRFTEQPDPVVASIVGDFIYNVRSALDHLRAVLVPKNRERRGYFPIYFPGVWEPAVAGEDTQRAKERSQWKTDTRGMKPEAIKILQQLQSEADSGDWEKPSALTTINRIAVKDRHTRVPVVAASLLNPTGTCRAPDGTMHILRGLPDREACATAQNSMSHPVPWT